LDDCPDENFGLLKLRGFDVELVEDLRGYAVKLPRYSKYAPALKNSVAMIETPEWRIFLMKDLAAVEEAQRQGEQADGGEVLRAAGRKSRPTIPLQRLLAKANRREGKPGLRDLWRASHQRTPTKDHTRTQIDLHQER
jgi:hypothetical protein